MAICIFEEKNFMQERKICDDKDVICPGWLA